MNWLVDALLRRLAIPDVRYNSSIDLSFRSADGFSVQNVRYSVTVLGRLAPDAAP